MSSIENYLELPSSLIAEMDRQRLLDVEDVRRQLRELEEQPPIEQTLDFYSGDALYEKPRSPL